MNKNCLVKPFRGSLLSHLMDDFFPFDEGKVENSSNISLSEDSDRVYVDAVLPGMEVKDIEVTLDKGMLWVRGDRVEKVDDKRKYYYRSNGSFSYRLALPESVDFGIDSEASYKDGILSIIFVKHKKEQPKRIDIKKG